MASKKFISALSQEKEGLAAVEAVGEKILAGLEGNPCDLAILFLSENYKNAEPEKLIEAFARKVPSRYFIGCNSSGVIGDRSEVEMEPAVSAMAMHLPGTRITPFTILPRELEALETAEELVKKIDVYPTDQPKFICLADPMSCDVTQLFRLFNEGYGNAPVIGGLASGVVAGEENWLALDGTLYKEGAVGLALTGEIEFENVVSQGCRPIGEPYIITRAEQNVLFELAGRPALQVLGDVYAGLNSDDQQLARHSLFVGLVMDETRHLFKRGDFLIRNIMGVDYEKGVLVIGEMLQPGQTLQFQLRDARAAEEDLQTLLENLSAPDAARAAGGILISCCGRGKGLFRESDHDVRLIQSLRGPVPLTGFFANGEFGPVDRKNYVHGYTSSLTILR